MAGYAPSTASKLFPALKATQSKPIANFVDFLGLSALAVNAPTAQSQMANFLKIAPVGAEMPGLADAVNQGHRWILDDRISTELRQMVHDEKQQPQQPPPSFQAGRSPSGGASSSAPAAAPVSEAAKRSQQHFFSVLVPFLINRALEWEDLFPTGGMPFLAAPRKADFEAAQSRRIDQQIVLTRRQILCAHALAFLGAEPIVQRKDVGQVGSLSWKSLFMGRARVGVERILCQLCYFEYWRTNWPSAPSNEDEAAGVAVAGSNSSGSKSAATSSSAAAAAATSSDTATSCPKLDDVCRYTRVSLTAANIPDTIPPYPDWKTSETRILRLPRESTGMTDEQASKRFGEVITRQGIEIESHFLENFVFAQSLVDFANQSFATWALIPSTTQEEVLCSTNPELMIGMILADTMLPGATPPGCEIAFGSGGPIRGLDPEIFESISASNCFYYSRYVGYRDTFRFSGCAAAAGSKRRSHSPCIVGIDAHVNFGDQFSVSSGMVERDLVKIFCGLIIDDVQEPVATGPLGCGAFQGDCSLKLLQQLMALAESGKAACYHDRHPLAFSVMTQLMRLKQLRVKHAWQWIVEFGRSPNARVTQGSSDAPPPTGDQALAGHAQPDQHKVTEHDLKKMTGEDDDGASSAAEITRLERLGGQLLEAGGLMKRSFGEFMMIKLLEFPSPHDGNKQ